MNIYFHYSFSCYKVLRVERVLGSDDRGANIIDTLAHDFRGSLNKIVRSEPLKLSKEEISKEKSRVATAIRAHKNLKKNHYNLYKENKDEVIKAIINARTPNFGSFKFSLL